MSGHDHGREPLPPSWFETNVQTIVRAVVAICVLLLVGDVVFHFVGHKHVHFAVEGWVGFYAVVGFVSYVGLVLTAKQLRKLVMRGLDFYGEEVPDSIPDGLAPPREETKRADKAMAEPEPPSETIAQDLGDTGDSDEESDVGDRQSESGSESESESESDDDEEDAR